MSSLSKIKPMKKPSFVDYQIFFARPIGPSDYYWPPLPQGSMPGTSPLPVAEPLAPVPGQQPKAPPSSKIPSGTESPVKKQQ